MKLDLEDSGIMHSTGQHMNTESLTRTKSSLGAANGDIVNRDGDLQVDMYSPMQKFSKRELASRVHCIPILMVFVFFVLWCASSEIVPEVNATPDMFLMKMANPSESTTTLEHGQKLHSNVITLPHHDVSSRSNHATKSKDSLPGQSYMRGTARDDER